MFILNKQKGLTLIELLAVIAIIAILFVLLIPQISSAFDKARETEIMTDFRSYETALKSYFSENNKVSTIDSLNKFLDENLQIKSSSSSYNGNSNKITSFDISYRIFIEGDEQVTVRVSKTKGKETHLYGLVVWKDNSEIKSRTFGFSENIGITKSGVENGFVYEIFQNEEVIIKNYIGNSTNLVIPNTIENLPVTVLENTEHSEGKSLYGKNLNSVILPNQLRQIGERSLSGNNFTSIIIPSSVKYISQSALRENKITSVILPSDLKILGRSAFQGNELTSIIFNSNLKVISGAAFGLNKLSSLNLPNGLEVIEAQSFVTNLISTVILPNGLLNVGDSAFKNNPLTTYTISPSTQTENSSFPPNAVKQ